MFNKYNPDTQIDMYDFVAYLMYRDVIPIQGVMIELAQTAVGFSRFRRHFIKKTDDQRDEFFREVKWLIRMAETAAKDDYFPMQRKACQNYGGCKYRKYCAMSPVSRDMMIKAELEYQPWNPLEIRE